MLESKPLQVTSIGDEAAVGPSAITSIALTPDGEFLLANMRSHTGHLWRVGPIARRMAKPVPDGATNSSHYGLAPPGVKPLILNPKVPPSRRCI